MGRTFMMGVIGLAAAVGIGCATQAEDEAGSSESANTGGIAEGTPEAAIVLRFANDASFDELVSKARLPQLAALAIDAYRKGDDLAAGTEDDERFESLAELDRIPHVGPNEFGAMLAYADARQSAVIAGRVLLPNDSPVQPAANVYAFKTDGSRYFKYETRLNGAYALAVDPGEYYVVAYVGPVRSLVHTTSSDLPTPVRVRLGETVTGIDAHDGAARRVPIEPTSPASFGCNGKDYAGRCGTTAEFDLGPGGALDTVIWCEGNILRRKTCPDTQRCAWQSDAIGYNCVPR